MSTIQEFNYNINILQALLWQYNSATNLQGLTNYKNDWLVQNYSNFWTDWYNQVFWLWNPLPKENPQSFSDFGCAVWAIILGIPLQIVEPPDDTYDGFGFENHPNFDNAPFFDDNEEIYFPRDLRVLILKLRYFQLVTRGAVLEINAFLKAVFADYPQYTGIVYVLDNHDMTMTYVFTAPIPSDLGIVLDKYDILPRPASVEINILIQPELVFGFENHQNFDNGPFIQEI